jgi:hypothetical protein
VSEAVVSSQWEAAGLVNVDGGVSNLDIIWRNISTGRLSAWLLNADGTLDEAVTIVDSLSSNWQMFGLTEY